MTTHTRDAAIAEAHARAKHTGEDYYVVIDERCLIAHADDLARYGSQFGTKLRVKPDGTVEPYEEK